MGLGRLVGHARVTGGDSAGFTLDGRVIDYRLDDRVLTWVQAQGNADATADQWRIVADTIQFDLLNNQIERGNAWGNSNHPRAISLINTITADSLAIDAPGQQLSEVRGIGAARATARGDSLDTEPDWVVGDTVVAHFDSTGTGRRVLSGLEAHGSARARYRVYPESDPTGPPDISYSRGQTIIALFVADRVQRVEVIGQTDGVYLESPRRRGQ